MVFSSKCFSFYLKNKSVLNENNFLNMFLLNEFYKKITEHNNILLNRQFKISFYNKNYFYKLRKLVKRKRIRILYKRRFVKLKRINLIKTKLKKKTNLYYLKKKNFLNNINIRQTKISTNLLKLSSNNFNKKLNMLKYTKKKINIIILIIRL
jgi:hypothetical protein